MTPWYYAMLMVREGDTFHSPSTAVFVMACTTLQPKLPNAAKMLGRVMSRRSDALVEAIEYLRAELVVSRVDESK